MLNGLRKECELISRRKCVSFYRSASLLRQGMEQGANLCRENLRNWSCLLRKCGRDFPAVLWKTASLTTPYSFIHFPYGNILESNVHIYFSFAKRQYAYYLLQYLPRYGQAIHGNVFSI